MKASCSMFSQILKLIPRTDFVSLVKERGAERVAKALSSWSQFVAMMSRLLGRANSLREIEGGLRSCEGKPAHPGIEAPKRLLLSYPRRHRPWRHYERVSCRPLERLQGSLKAGHKSRLKNNLVNLESTFIELCLSVFGWAKYNRMRGAIKLHLVLDHDGHMPCFGLITDGDVHDVKVAQRLEFAPGTVLAEHRGYTDHGIYSRWTGQGVYFVARLRKNVRFKVVQRQEPPQSRGILADETIRLTGSDALQRRPSLPRRIEAVREDTGEVLVFLTNHHGLARQHRGSHLEEALADRAALQGPQAEPEAQDFRRYLASRGKDPDPVCAHQHVPVETRTH